jgi:hypothetical protein
VAYLVGEQGPEIVTFGSSGHVSTNADSRRMLAGGGNGGGDTHVHIHMQSGFVGSTTGARGGHVRRAAAGEESQAWTRSMRDPEVAA